MIYMYIDQIGVSGSVYISRFILLDLPSQYTAISKKVALVIHDA